jgi:hypothetical protein
VWEHCEGIVKVLSSPFKAYIFFSWSTYYLPTSITNFQGLSTIATHEITIQNLNREPQNNGSTTTVGKCFRDFGRSSEPSIRSSARGSSRNA